MAHREKAYRRSLLRVPAFVLAAACAGARRLLAAAAQGLLFRRPRGDESKVVVYRIGSIGDFVHALPALSAIRRRHKTAEITLVTNAVGGESWPERMGIDRALGLQVANYTSSAELRQAVRGAQCLYYLAPHPLGLLRALRDALFFSTCAVWRARGFTALTPRGWAARALRPWRDAPPQYQRLLDSCALEDGAREPLPAGAGADQPAVPYVVLAPTGKSAVQRWPDERYIQLAQAFAGQGLLPVWAGSAEDGQRLAALGDLPGESRFGALDFAALTGLMRGAQRVIGNDSGLIHLAAYAGARVVVVSSARAAAYAWRPPGDATVLRKDMNCEACHLRECSDTACLAMIRVEDVLAATGGA